METPEPLPSEADIRTFKMERKTVLFAPLNWGLGHATRSIPIIYSYINNPKYRVVLAADGQVYEFLKMEFPDIDIFKIKDIDVSYLKGIWLPLGVLITGLKMIWVNVKEHKALQKLIEDEKVELIISDNRYGMWNKKVKSILITHQLTIIPPKIFRFMQPLFKRFLKQKLSKFNEIWIPDFEEFPGLAGKLSHQQKIHPNIKYIGPQSRYTKIESITLKAIVAVVSGPMPFRKQLAQRLIELADIAHVEMELYCNNIEISDTLPSVKVIQNASFLELNKALNQAELVIASGGYSTLMDMVKLNKKAILIPTPHQSEQNYLAKIYHANIKFSSFETLNVDVFKTE